MENEPGHSGISTPVRKSRGLGISKLPSHSKNIIFSVYNFIKDLAENPDKISTVDFKKAQVLTGRICGVGPKTVQKICDEILNPSEDQSTLHTTKKAVKRKGKVTDIDEFEKGVLRRTINEYYDRGEYPTISNLRKDMAERTGFSGSDSSMLRILKKLGLSTGNPVMEDS